MFSFLRSNRLPVLLGLGLCGLLTGCVRESRLLGRADWGFLDPRRNPVAEETAKSKPKSGGPLNSVAGKGKTPSSKTEDPFLKETLDDEPSGPPVKVAKDSPVRTLMLPDRSDAPQVPLPADDDAPEVRVTANRPITTRREPQIRIAAAPVQSAPASSLVEILPSPSEKPAEPVAQPAVAIEAAPSPLIRPASRTTAIQPPVVATAEASQASSPVAVKPALEAKPAVVFGIGGLATAGSAAVPEFVEDQSPESQQPVVRPAAVVVSESRLPTVWKGGQPENLSNVVAGLEAGRRPQQSPALEALLASRQAELPESEPAPRTLASTSGKPPVRPVVMAPQRPRTPSSGEPAFQRAVVVARRSAPRLSGRIDLDSETPPANTSPRRLEIPNAVQVPQPLIAPAETPEPQAGPKLLAPNAPAPVPVQPPKLPVEAAVDAGPDVLEPAPLERPTRLRLTSASRFGLGLGLAGLLGIGLWRFLEWRRFRTARPA